jgi:hypothetical protein
MTMANPYKWAIAIILAFSLVQTHVVTEWETDAAIMEYTK